VPATLPATVRRSDLGDVATVAELAAYLRLDDRTLRKALEAGSIAGAERIGRTWRIHMNVYDRSRPGVVV